jgi:hypothetical protein
MQSNARDGCYLLKKPPRAATAVLFLRLSMSLLFCANFFDLGASLSSVFFATRYTVDPTISSLGPRSTRASCFSTSATRLFLGRREVEPSAASSSSLEESVRNSSGSRLGAFLLVMEGICGSSLICSSSSAGSGTVCSCSSFLDFRRPSACCLNSASLSCRLRFSAVACL